MSGDFDPYYKWLGIPRKDQPPNHYRLLAIELFESDREVIDAAANRLMSYLKSLATGEDLASSQKLLNEVSAARRCLLDPKSKAAYDAQLRVPETNDAPPAAESKALDDVAAPEAADGMGLDFLTAPEPEAVHLPAEPPSPLPPPPGEELNFLAAGPATPATTSRSPAPPAKRSSFWQQVPTSWIAIGACAVSGLLVIILFVLMSGGPEPVRHSRPTDQPFSRRTSPTRTDAPGALPPAMPAWAGAAPEVRPAPFTVTPDESGKMPPLPANVPETPPPAPQPAAPESNKQPPATPEPSKPAKPAPPVDPLASLPKVLNLPPAIPADASAPRQPSSLGKLNLAERQKASLQLLGGDEVLGNATFHLAAEPSKGDRWRLDLLEPGRRPQPIGEFIVGGGELRFAWLPAIEDPRADFVRNCLLEIAVGQNVQRRQLRQVQSAGQLPLITADESGRTKPKAIELPSSPETSRLEMEVTAVSGPAPYQAITELPKRGKVGQDFDILLQGKQPEFPPVASLSASLRNEKLYLKSWLSLKPLVPLRGNKQFVPFASKNFFLELLELPKIEAMYQEGIPSRNPANQNLKPADRKKLDEEYAARNALPLARIAFLKHIKEMDELATKLHDKVQIQFAIFTTVAGNRVDLIRTTPPPSKAGGSK